MLLFYSNQNFGSLVNSKDNDSTVTNFYVDSDGKGHMIATVGADSVDIKLGNDGGSVCLGTFGASNTSSGSFSVNVKNYTDVDVSGFTVNNFVFAITTVFFNIEMTKNFNYSFNASTGIFTVSWNTYGVITVRGNLYMILS